VPKLTHRTVQSIKKAGVHSDGGGLYLNVATGGTKSWILRTTVRGRVTPSGNPYRVEVGLGSVELVSLAEARDEALKLRKLARAGTNPLDERRKETLTFEQAARRVYDNLLPTWRNQKHANVWIASLEADAFPRIGSTHIDLLGTADVLAVLSPIWTTKHETARRVKQRISTVFDWAKGAGHYSHENPVNGLKRALPSVKRRATHLAALDWRAVPAFMDDLSKREGISARTLEFIILTAARSGEARGARWSEIDFNDAVWIVPAERMKRGVTHRVPLSEKALGVLSHVRGLDDELIFPSIQRASDGGSREQSVMVFKSLFKRMGREGITTHGFRSSFRDWCSDSAHADRQVAEACLAHSLGDDVESAYLRSDLYERRRVLIQRWADFVSNGADRVLRMIG